MKVRELIEELQKHDPDAEAHVETENSVVNGTSEAEHVYTSTATYGILLPEPSVVDIVVIAES